MTLLLVFVGGGLVDVRSLNVGGGISRKSSSLWSNLLELDCLADMTLALNS